MYRTKTQLVSLTSYRSLHLFFQLLVLLDDAPRYSMLPRNLKLTISVLHPQCATYQSVFAPHSGRESEYIPYDLTSGLVPALLGDVAVKWCISAEVGDSSAVLSFMIREQRNMQ